MGVALVGVVLVGVAPVGVALCLDQEQTSSCVSVSVNPPTHTNNARTHFTMGLIYIHTHTLILTGWGSHEQEYYWENVSCLESDLSSEVSFSTVLHHACNDETSLDNHSTNQTLTLFFLDFLLFPTLSPPSLVETASTSAPSCCRMIPPVLLFSQNMPNFFDSSSIHSSCTIVTHTATR